MAAPRADGTLLAGWLFRLSLLVVALWGLVRFGLDFPAAELWSGDPHHPLRARIAAAPLFLTGFIVLLWFGVYRPHGIEARPVALAIGLGMGAMGAAQLLAGSPGLGRAEVPFLLLLAGAAHVGWGLCGQRV